MGTNNLAKLYQLINNLEYKKFSDKHVIDNE